MAVKPIDYYAILQIPRTASQEDVKQAFRRLARQHHPDLHAEKEKDLHTRRMQEINEAYSVLGSKENRAKYDQFGEHWQNGPPPPPRPSQEAPYAGEASSFDGQGAAGFSDFFRNMFQQGERGTDRGDFSSAAELDIEAMLELSLEESVRGVEKLFTLTAEGVCPTCHGTGRVQQAFCPTCGGVGELRQPREVRAKIPAGLTENARIRLKGQGNEGPHGRGDLYLRIRLRPDPRFTVNGKNLETELKAMPWEASLGAELPVPTLEGPLRIRIPKGTHTGKQLRLAGKGLGKQDARGDLYVRMVIDIPDHLSPKAETLMKELKEDTHDPVR